MTEPSVDLTQDRRRYRKLYARLWADPDFCALSPAEKLVAIYLLCGPQTNRCGLYKLSFAAGAEHLSVRQSRFATRTRACIGKFFWELDEASHVLWIPSWWSYNNPGERESNFKGALTDLGEIPPTDLLAKFCNNLRDLSPTLHPYIQMWLPKGPRSGTARTQPSHSKATGSAQVELQEKTRQEGNKRRVQAVAPNVATPDAGLTHDLEPELGLYEPTFALLERMAHAVLDVTGPDAVETDIMETFHQALKDAHLPRDKAAMHRALDSARVQRALFGRTG